MIYENGMVEGLVIDVRGYTGNFTFYIKYSGYLVADNFKTEKEAAEFVFTPLCAELIRQIHRVTLG
jgi:hypothetical protein